MSLLVHSICLDKNRMGKCTLSTKWLARDKSLFPLISSRWWKLLFASFLVDKHFLIFDSIAIFTHFYSSLPGRFLLLLFVSPAWKTSQASDKILMYRPIYFCSETGSNRSDSFRYLRITFLRSSESSDSRFGAFDFLLRSPREHREKRRLFSLRKDPSRIFPKDQRERKQSSDERIILLVAASDSPATCYRRLNLSF